MAGWQEWFGKMSIFIESLFDKYSTDSFIKTQTNCEQGIAFIGSKILHYFVSKCMLQRLGLQNVTFSDGGKSFEVPYQTFMMQFDKFFIPSMLFTSMCMSSCTLEVGPRRFSVLFEIRCDKY